MNEHKTASLRRYTEQRLAAFKINSEALVTALQEIMNWFLLIIFVWGVLRIESCSGEIIIIIIALLLLVATVVHSNYTRQVLCG